MGQDGKADFAIRRGEHAGADDLSRKPISKVEHAPPEATWNEANGQEVACQIKDVLEIIGIAELTDHIVQDDL